MFIPGSLRSAVIVATALMLTAGGVWATENKRDESKPQSGAGQSKESSFTITGDSAVSQAQSLGNDNRAKRADLGDGITMEFVRIPPGSFYMRPAHHVQFIQPFYMGKYEVTQAQWKASVLNIQYITSHGKKRWNSAKDSAPIFAYPLSLRGNMPAGLVRKLASTTVMTLITHNLTCTLGTTTTAKVQHIR